MPYNNPCVHDYHDGQAIIENTEPLLITQTSQQMRVINAYYLWLEVLYKKIVGDNNGDLGN